MKTIQYLTHKAIDKTKWDDCVDKAENGLIYVYSYYLDAMSANWDALVMGDYEWIMPLTWNKKYTIHYLYQPFFCAQLGIFGNEITQKLVQNFLEHVPQKFKYWDFYLNSKNLFSIPGFPMYERGNFILSLDADYKTLSGSYAQSHIRNIKRAIKTGNEVRKDIPIKEVIALSKEQSQSFSKTSDRDFENFRQLLQFLQLNAKVKSYGVYSTQNKLMASCVFLFSHKRAYYILVGNHPDGRTSGASHLMIDYFIQEHAGQDLILDFEGSSISSLAFFYKSFGGQLEKFAGIKLNRLSAISKLFGK
jgi:hypothetical protein